MEDKRYKSINELLTLGIKVKSTYTTTEKTAINAPISTTASPVTGNSTQTKTSPPAILNSTSITSTTTAKTAINAPISTTALYTPISTINYSVTTTVIPIALQNTTTTNFNSTFKQYKDINELLLSGIKINSPATITANSSATDRNITTKISKRKTNPQSQSTISPNMCLLCSLDSSFTTSTYLPAVSTARQVPSSGYELFLLGFLVVPFILFFLVFKFLNKSHQSQRNQPEHQLQPLPRDGSYLTFHTAHEFNSSFEEETSH